MDHKYILVNKVPVVELNLMIWAKWFENSDRMVEITDIIELTEEVRVSTVFIGIDHNFHDGTPILFETIVFGGKHSNYQDSYCTWDESIIGHRRIVNMVNRDRSRIVIVMTWIGRLFIKTLSKVLDIIYGKDRVTSGNTN